MTKQRDDDIDFQIQFYEGILKQKGDFIQALIAVGDLYTQKGFYEQGLAVDQQLSHLRPEDPIILYNLACSYSLLNKIDEALITIQQAIAAGYENLTFLEQDSDLANLFQDEKFQRYFADIKKKMKHKGQHPSAFVDGL
jgi:tetratricopeptide (TPR) repeat protein